MEELHQLMFYMLQLDEDIEEVNHEYDDYFYYSILLDMMLFYHLKMLNHLKNVLQDHDHHHLK
jgi:hypothetical protein